MALEFHDQEFIDTKFGKGGQVDVLGWFGDRVGSTKVYVVRCNVCSKDPELFGDGTFNAVKRDLLAGRLPCGCSLTKWTLPQWKVIVRRYADNRKDVELLGFTDEFKGDKTKLHLKCCVDGHVWDTTTIQNFKQGGGCPVCKRRKLTEAASKPHEESIKEFLDTGFFLPGTVIWKSDKIVPAASKSKIFWKYTCPKCSNDEYVQAGLCSGVFEMQAYRFRQGSHACRCAPAVKWTKAQREHQVVKALEQDGKGVKFVGWEGGNYFNDSRMYLDCPTHGESDISVASFFMGQRCPKCTEFGYKPGRPGYVYVLKVDHAKSKFTGYGITNLKKARINQHRCTLKKTEHTIVEKIMFEVDGLDARKIEKEISDNFECVPQNTTSFKREATSWDKFSRVVDFVKDWLVGNDRQVLYA